MILDKQQMMSDAQALTATAVSTDYIDLGSSRDIGAGRPIQLLCQVTSALLSGGASTLDVAVETDTQSSFATAKTLVRSAALIPKASLVAGFEPLNIHLPEGVQRYIRMSYTVGTANFTGGTISAGLLIDKDQQAFYPSGLGMSGF